MTLRLLTPIRGWPLALWPSSMISCNFLWYWNDNDVLKKKIQNLCGISCSEGHIPSPTSSCHSSLRSASVSTWISIFPYNPIEHHLFPLSSCLSSCYGKHFQFPPGSLWHLHIRVRTLFFGWQLPGVPLHPVRCYRIILCTSGLSPKTDHFSK